MRMILACSRYLWPRSAPAARPSIPPSRAPSASSDSSAWLVSSEEVNAGAEKAYAQMMAEAQKKGALDKRCRAGARASRRSSAGSSRRPPRSATTPPKWAWEAHVLTTDEVNAWCMPGGKMAVYTGLIKKLQATDDELAAVMGHEIAHALREHSREQISQPDEHADRRSASPARSSASATSARASPAWWRT